MYLSVGKKTTYFFSSQEFRYYYSMAILHRTVYLPVAPCRWFFFIIAATWCVLVVVYMSMFRHECHATWHDSQGKRHSVRSERSRWRNSCSLFFVACVAGAKRGEGGGGGKGKGNPPSLFPFLPIPCPCPLPLSTPATQAMFFAPKPHGNACYAG